ncbi:MAG: DinB family protein [Longimicrobiales bacterium]
MARGRPLEVEQELIEAFRHGGLVNEYLASVLPVAIWRLTPPGGRGRSIAAILAHMQGVRRTFARMGGARPGPPALDRQRVTPKEACRALRQSTEDLARLFESAFASRRPRVKGMPRRAINMLAYLMQHDAHHRGQICMLARDLGHEFSGDDTMRLWGWKAISARPEPRWVRRPAKRARADS